MSNVVRFPRNQTNPVKNPAVKRDDPALVILLPVIRIECAPDWPPVRKVRRRRAKPDG